MTDDRHQRYPPDTASSDEAQHSVDELAPDDERVIELREERLVAHKDLRDVGEVVVRTDVEMAPAQLEVDALREEVEIQHEPVGEGVNKREEPWEENGVLVVPVYEEQLVVTKRLVLKERLRVRRIAITERQLFQDTVRRERLAIEDPQQTNRVHEVYPTGGTDSRDGDQRSDDADETRSESGSLLTNFVRKALE